jgi:isopentenyldiphosphate isomerase
MEWVDIVNASDQIIGKTTKKSAHLKGLLHRTVIAEVIDSRGNFLLVRQSPRKQDLGQFVSPMGGHVKSGESEISALKRETAEELGYMDFDYRFVGKLIYNRFVQDHQENHLFIVYEIHTDLCPTLNAESVSFRWFTPRHLKSQLKKFPSQFGAPFLYLTQKLYPGLYR